MAMSGGFSSNPPVYSQSPPPAYVQTAYALPPPPPMMVVNHQAAVIRSSQSAMVVCPFCGQSVMTQIRHEIGAAVWLVCLFMLLMGLALGCCLLPFCMGGLKDTYHVCPNCKSTITVYRPLTDS